VGCWWIKRALFVLKFLLKSGQSLTPYRPHPQYLLASPTAPTGLTPNPSPRGEGSGMLCWLRRPHPQPLSKGRGEWYVLLVQERFSVDEKTC